MPETKKPVHIISDLPEKNDVVFGFKAYARTIAEVAANKENKTPLVIGIYGPWGSGKTTLMEKVREYLDNDTLFFDEKETVEADAKEAIVKKPLYRTCKTVWFQAWKYDKEDEILAGLIEKILQSIKKDKPFVGKLEDLKDMISQLDVTKAVCELLESFLDVDVNKFFKDRDYREKLGFIDTFQEFFKRLVWTYTNVSSAFESGEEPNDKNGALVVFIDDLDRCPPPRIKKVLETIKLFMDIEGCVFIIGAAADMIIKALAPEYEDKDAREFLDKIVHVTFSLPEIRDDDFESYLSIADPDTRETVKQHLTSIVQTTRYNPRKFKRFLNDLYLMEGIHKNINTGVDFKNLLLWQLIEFEDHRIKEQTKESIALLKQRVDQLAEKDPVSGQFQIPDEKIRVVKEDSLIKFLENRIMVDLLRRIDLSEEQIEKLVSLKDVVKISDPELYALKRIISEEYDSKTGPDFGKMVPIPAGIFKFQESEEADIEIPYEIDIYPVTNQQFKQFIKDNGYKNEKFWKENWDWLQKEKITEPRYWRKEKWNKPDYPVVGVSYFEAKAYAEWAGKRLPDEKEWERAARGTDGREFPWEGGFDKEKCNTRESNIGGTTPVTRYPNGISLAGCYDMAGNVYEWTTSDYDRYTKVVRGGSWSYDRGLARCAYRFRINPSSRTNDVGFRCVRTLK